MDELQKNDLFRTAIGRELEAYTFYKDVAERVNNAAVKQIFEELSIEEKRHEEMLWKMKGDDTVSFKINAPQDLKVAETVDLPPLSMDMKPADAIALAMKKEEQAVAFYQALANMCQEEETKRIYTELSKMEMTHKHRLENAFVDIGYPEVW